MVVKYDTKDLIAVKGRDYSVDDKQEIVFEKGEVSKMIEICIKDDMVGCFRLVGTHNQTPLVHQNNWGISLLVSFGTYICFMSVFTVNLMLNCRYTIGRELEIFHKMFHKFDSVDYSFTVLKGNVITNTLLKSTK